MKNNRTDDIKFLINTLSFTLVLVALLVTFQPYLENDTRLAEVKQVEGRIISMEPKDLSPMLVSGTAKPVLLVAYASWCPYCRQLMPTVVEMVKNHAFGNVVPVFVSLDDEPRKLSRYLVHNNYHTVFAPYMVDHSLSAGISSAMRSSGSHFTGTIPYVGFFGTDGKVKAESVGLVDEQRLLAMAQTVQ